METILNWVAANPITAFTLCVVLCVGIMIPITYAIRRMVKFEGWGFRIDFDPPAKSDTKPA